MQLQAISKIVKPDDSLEVFMTGFQADLTGKSYLMIQYKYASDTNKPPHMLLVMIFDDKDKIIGIRPLSLTGGAKF